MDDYLYMKEVALYRLSAQYFGCAACNITQCGAGQSHHSHSWFLGAAGCCFQLERSKSRPYTTCSAPNNRQAKLITNWWTHSGAFNSYKARYFPQGSVEIKTELKGKSYLHQVIRNVTPNECLCVACTACFHCLQMAKKSSRFKLKYCSKCMQAHIQQTECIKL